MADHDIMAGDTVIADVVKVMRTLLPGGLPPSQEDNVRAMLEAYLPGPLQGDLFDPPPREGNRLVKAAMAMVREDSPGHDPSLALAIKLAITIGHVRARRWDRVLPSEFAIIADVFGVQTFQGKGEWAPRGTAPEISADAPVEFMFLWRSATAPKRGTFGTSTCHVGIAEVDSVDAPVACSLWTPEQRLALRRHEAGWLRPVLAPGSWAPITLHEFREAARSGCAWPDTPFRSTPRGGLPSFHLLDLAGPQPLTAASARRISDARDACLVGAGLLHVVDGIVHRTSGPPMAGIATTFSGNRWLTGPAWRIDDISSSLAVHTFGGTSVATWFNAVPTPDRTGGGDPNGSFVTLSDWIGVSRFLEARAGRFGLGPAPNSPSIGDLAWATERPPGVPDVHGCLRVAAGMAMRLLPLAHMLELIGHHVGACVRLKEALAASKERLDAGREVEARSLATIRALCAEVLSVDWPATDPLGGMWTYVASLASHAADVGTSLHDEDEELVGLQI